MAVVSAYTDALTSRFTEAHFAAALLSCGPHVVACPECRHSNNVCPNVTMYRNTVNNYFWRSLDPDHPSKDSIKAAKLFWAKYLNWVTS